jgi:hypothetical protein
MRLPGLSSLVYQLQLLATAVLVLGLFAVPAVFMQVHNPAAAILLEDDVMGDRFAVVYLPEGTSWMTGGGGAPRPPQDLPANAEVPEFVEQPLPNDQRPVYRPKKPAKDQGPSPGASARPDGPPGRGGTGSGSGEGDGTGAGEGDGDGPGKGEASAGGGGRRRDCPPTHPAITQLGPYEYRIQRVLVDTYTVNTSALERLGWVRAHDDASGQLDGFEIGGFGCAGVLYYAGLRRLDVIHEVNEKPVTTLAQALAVYKKFRKADTVRLRVTRKGARVVLTYHLVD